MKIHFHKTSNQNALQLKEYTHFYKKNCFFNYILHISAFKYLLFSSIVSACTLDYFEAWQANYADYLWV